MTISWCEPYRSGTRTRTQVGEESSGLFEQDGFGLGVDDGGKG